MVRDRRTVWSDRRAISDAIAVLLLLGAAITLATVAIVTGFAKIPTSAPTAQLSITSSGGNIYISHYGGDSLNVGQLRYALYGSNGTLSDNGPFNSDNLRDANGDGLFNGGDRLVLSCPSGVTGFLDFVLIHTPSGRTIAQGTVSC